MKRESEGEGGGREENVYLLLRLGRGNLDGLLALLEFTAKNKNGMNGV